jgi:hypothetical protein
MGRSKPVVWPLLAAACVFLAAPGGADAKPKGRKPQQVVPTGEEDSASAPAPDAAAELRLERMLSRSSEGLVEVRREDGTVAVDLEGRFQNVMVAVPTAGGHSLSCMASHAQLKRVGAAAPAKTGASRPALEEK